MITFPLWIDPDEVAPAEDVKRARPDVSVDLGLLARAEERVEDPDVASGGEVSEPSQVYFAGIVPWWVKLDEVICMCASAGLARAGTKRSRPGMSRAARTPTRRRVGVGASLSALVRISGTSGDADYRDPELAGMGMNSSTSIAAPGAWKCGWPSRSRSTSSRDPAWRTE